MAQYINGHVFYDENDVYTMLENLYNLDVGSREQIYAYVYQNETGIDRQPLLNIVRDPMEYNMDYLYRLDSDVTEKFIRLMERFGIARRF